MNVAPGIVHVVTVLWVRMSGMQNMAFIWMEIHLRLCWPFLKLCQVFQQRMWWVVICECCVELGVICKHWHQVVHDPGISLTNIVNNIGPGQTPGEFRLVHCTSLIVLHVPSVAGLLGMPLSKLRPCPLFQNSLLVSEDADVVRCRMPSHNRGIWHQRVCCASLQMFNVSNKFVFTLFPVVKPCYCSQLRWFILICSTSCCTITLSTVLQTIDDLMSGTLACYLVHFFFPDFL